MVFIVGRADYQDFMPFILKFWLKQTAFIIYRTLSFILLSVTLILLKLVTMIIDVVYGAHKRVHCDKPLYFVRNLNIL